MTAITNALRPHLANHRPARSKLQAPSAAQESQLLFGLALIFLAGGAAITLHALHAVTAFS